MSTDYTGSKNLKKSLPTRETSVLLFKVVQRNLVTTPWRFNAIHSGIPNQLSQVLIGMGKRNEDRRHICEFAGERILNFVGQLSVFRVLDGVDDQVIRLLERSCNFFFSFQFRFD